MGGHIPFTYPCRERGFDLRVDDRDTQKRGGDRRQRSAGPHLKPSLRCDVREARERQLWSLRRHSILNAQLLADGARRARARPDLLYTSKFWRPEKGLSRRCTPSAALFPRARRDLLAARDAERARLPSMNFANMAAKPQNDAETALRAVQIDGQVRGSSGD